MKTLKLSVMISLFFVLAGSVNAQIYRYLLDSCLTPETAIMRLSLAPQRSDLIIGTIFNGYNRPDMFFTLDLNNLQVDFEQAPNVSLTYWMQRLNIYDSVTVKRIFNNKLKESNLPVVVSQGFIFIGKKDTIYVYDSQGHPLKKDSTFKRFYVLPNDIKNISHSTKRRWSGFIQILDMLYDWQTNLIYIATNKGLLTLNKKPGKPAKTLRLLFAGNIIKLKKINDTLYYFVTTNGIYQFYPHKSTIGKRLYFSEKNKIVDFQLIDTMLWVIDKDQLVAQNLKTGKQIFFNTNSKIPFGSKTAHKLISDTINNYLWIATYGSGLYYIDLRELDSVLTLLFCGDNVSAAEGEAEDKLLIYRLQNYVSNVKIIWNFYSFSDSIIVYDGYYKTQPLDTVKPIFQTFASGLDTVILPVSNKYLTVIVKAGKQGGISKWDLKVECIKGKEEKLLYSAKPE